MVPQVEQLKNKFYYGVPGWTNGTSRYYQEVQANLPAKGAVVDLGAGPGSPHYPDLRRPGLRVVGLDRSAKILDNPTLDEARVGDLYHLPFPQASFEVALANYVFEHLEHGDLALREINRVLKPGGKLIFRTPNLWHYTILIGRLTPHGLHQLVADRVRGLNREAGDIHPTFYRMNTCGRLHRQLAAAGFTVRTLFTIEPEPSYLMFSSYAFLLGVLYERLVNATVILSALRANIIGTAIKK